MSNNYSQPRGADIPVTDLDASDEDIVYDHNDRNKNTRFLDDLDFELGDTSPGIFKKLHRKVASFFNRDGYERFSRGYNFDVSTDSLDLENVDPSAQLRNYKIPRLYKRLKIASAALMALFLVLILGTFFLKSNKKEFKLQNSKIILSNSTHDFYPTTLVVSLDGFHPHYINSNLTPMLHLMMLNDYGAPYMVPSFPSSTFPNHWTLITGLFPSEHGIVGNTFFDPKLHKQFVNTNPRKGGLDPEFWQGGEPVWTTAFKQGVNSAVHMWPGSEVPGIGIGGGPLEVDKFNGSEQLYSKTARVMSWLDRKDLENRPELILTYVPIIDTIGHQYGIGGKEIEDALRHVDGFIASLKDELQQRNLTDIVNLIVLSDHGMAPTSNDRLLYLDDLIDLKKVEHIDGWPLFGLRPLEKYLNEEILDEVKENFSKMDPSLQEHYSIYTKQEVPKEFQFGGEESEHKFNYRLAPIWIVPKVGYSVTTRKQMDDLNHDYQPKGVHGYNNTELLMRAIFLGTGPYFKAKLSKNRKINPFANVEVYNMICDTLNIDPAPNNGTFTKSKPLASSANRLSDEWRDTLDFPNLPFKVDHVVNNATYDFLWRDKSSLSEEGVSNEQATKSLSEYGATSSSFYQLILVESNTLSASTGKLQITANSNETPLATLGAIMDDFHDGILKIEDGIEKIWDEASAKLKEMADKIGD